MPTSNLPHDHDARMDRARLSLAGLSVGDAFGERFFAHPDVVEGLIRSRAIPAPPWRFTDDTMMALSVVEALGRHGGVDPDHLAELRRTLRRFAGLRTRDARAPGPHPRGRTLGRGLPEPLRREGTFGNGAAMRVAPVGAYFADDPDAVVEHARRSAVVTHAHPEAVAGAIAVAVAAARAWRLHGSDAPPDCGEFLDLVLPHVPESLVAEGIRRARDLDPRASVDRAVAVLGNGRASRRRTRCRSPCGVPAIGSAITRMPSG